MAERSGELNTDQKDDDEIRAEMPLSAAQAEGLEPVSGAAGDESDTAC